MNTYWVYIMSNRARTVLYIGMTNNLERRVGEHQLGAIAGFSRRYACTNLIYFEETNSVLAAIEREKEIKKWSRAKKDTLIRNVNPLLRDLSLRSR